MPDGFTSAVKKKTAVLNVSNRFYNNLPPRGGPTAAMEALAMKESPIPRDLFLPVKHEVTAIQLAQPIAPSANP